MQEVEQRREQLPRRTRQYVEHLGRAQRRRCGQIRVRSRGFVNNAG
jgi:hypothetical protein